VCGSDDDGFRHAGVHSPRPRRVWNDHRAEIKARVLDLFFAVLGALIIKLGRAAVEVGSAGIALGA